MIIIEDNIYSFHLLKATSPLKIVDKFLKNLQTIKINSINPLKSPQKTNVNISNHFLYKPLNHCAIIYAIYLLFHVLIRNTFKTSHE